MNKIIRLCILTLVTTIILGINSNVLAEITEQIRSNNQDAIDVEEENIEEECSIYNVGDDYIVDKKGTVTALKDKVYIKIGESPREVLGLSVTSNADKYLTLESSNKDIVDVTDNKIQGKTTGTAIITANLNNGSLATVDVVVYDVKPDDENNNQDMQATKQVQTIVSEMLSEETQEEINDDTANKIIEQVNQGKIIKTELDVKPINENTIEQEAQRVKDIMPLGTQVASFYDINLIIKGDNDKIGKIDSLQDNINVTLPIPQEIIDSDVQNRVYKVYSCHNNNTQEVEAKNNNNGTVTINVNKFSTYVLAYADTRKTERTENVNYNIIDSTTNNNYIQENTIETNKKTSKIRNVIIVTFLIILFLAIGLFALYKAKK